MCKSILFSGLTYKIRIWVRWFCVLESLGTVFKMQAPGPTPEILESEFPDLRARELEFYKSIQTIPTSLESCEVRDL